jgi:uncharacterized protein YkwD
MKRLIIFFLVLYVGFPQLIFGQNSDLNKKLNQEIEDSEMLVQKLLNNRIIELVNEYRISKGLNTLIKNDELEKGACLHSSEMIKYNFFSHTNKQNKALKTFEDRAEKGGYKNNKGLGENIFYSKYYFDESISLEDIAQEAMTDLANSPSHNRIMLESRFKDVGVCVVFKISTKDNSYTCYLTQMFGVR